MDGESPHHENSREAFAGTCACPPATLTSQSFGRTSVLKHEIVRLQRLGKQTSDEDEIARLLPSESRFETWQQHLEQAQVLRCSRLADANKEKKPGRAAADAPPVVRRSFRRAKPAEDGRRKELQGVLPAEQVREELGQILPLAWTGAHAVPHKMNGIFSL
eukprot:g16632.t1